MQQLRFLWYLFLLLNLFSTGEPTFTDQEIIEINNAKEALAIMSKHLNQGTTQVGYLDAINKAGTQIDYLKEVINPMDRILKR